MLYLFCVQPPVKLLVWLLVSFVQLAAKCQAWVWPHLPLRWGVHQEAIPAALPPENLAPGVRRQLWISAGSVLRRGGPCPHTYHPTEAPCRLPRQLSPLWVGLGCLQTGFSQGACLDHREGLPLLLPCPLHPHSSATPTPTFFNAGDRSLLCSQPQWRPRKCQVHPEPLHLAFEV